MAAAVWVAAAGVWAIETGPSSRAAADRHATRRFIVTLQQKAAHASMRGAPIQCSWRHSALADHPAFAIAFNVRPAPGAAAFSDHAGWIGGGRLHGVIDLAAFDLGGRGGR